MSERTSLNALESVPVPLRIRLASTPAAVIISSSASSSTGTVTHQSTRSLASMCSNAFGFSPMIAFFSAPTVLSEDTSTGNALDACSPLMRQKSVSVLVAMAVYV